MKRISIQNSVTGRSFGATFETQEQADAWISEQSTKQSWGKNEYFDLKEEKSHDNPRAVFVEEVSHQDVVYNDNFEPMEDENGDVVFVETIRYKYRIPCEYEVTIKDFVDTQANFNIRNKILSATDWLFISDNPVPTAHRTYYKNYRQYLRDADLSAEKLEMFDHYLARLHPELFMDGGDGAKIIAKFNAYL